MQISLQTSSSPSPIRAAFGYHLPYMDIYVPPAVIHHIDQIPECMTCFHFLITSPSMPPSLRLVPGAVGEPGTLALLYLLLLSACCYAWWRGSHRFLCRFMWTPIPSPVAAGTSGGSLSVLMGLMMFLQPLTWQTIANRNEPPATEARSAPVQWALVYDGVWYNQGSYCCQEDNNA